MTKFRARALLLILGVSLLCPLMSGAQEAGREDEAPAQETGISADTPEAALTGGEEPEDAPPAKGESAVEEIESAASGEAKALGFLPSLGIAFAVVILQAVLIRLMWALVKWISAKTAAWTAAHIKPLMVKRLKLLDTKQISDAIQFSLTILKWLVTAFQLYITIPIVLGLFPATKDYASTLFGYILTPLWNILINTIEYIPKLITIIIILLVTKYVLRALKFFANHIEKGRLVIHGFYPDWAQPTFNILRVLLYAFTVAIIYPYLPGSDSKFFQGISVFVGLIFSLGSSSAIGNLVAGMVITYMRPFKVGDFIKIKEVTGTVVEKSPFVVRILSKKNEYITFPNLTVLTSEIINYNTSADKDRGLIVHAGMTMGYAVPWPRVHEILLAAADKTSRTEKDPKPFVLQTSLDDFYCSYEINVYTKEVNELPGIYSELYQNIQDGFREAGIDLTAPHYEVFQESPVKNEGARPAAGGLKK